MSRNLKQKFLRGMHSFRDTHNWELEQEVEWLGDTIKLYRCYCGETHWKKDYKFSWRLGYGIAYDPASIIHFTGA